MKHILIIIAAVVLVGCSPNPQNLLNAVKERNHEKVIKLLRAGVDVNARVNDDTALHNAASLGYASIVKMLIQAGADVNIKKEKTGVNRGRTPLHAAAYNSRNKAWLDAYLEIADLLIKNGAKVNVQSVGFAGTGKKTPLDECWNKEGKMPALLRKHGGKTGEELKAEGK